MRAVCDHTRSKHVAQHGQCFPPIMAAGKQHYLDASVAYKRAVLNCIYYLEKFGYTKEQARPTAPVTLCWGRSLASC